MKKMVTFQDSSPKARRRYRRSKKRKTRVLRKDRSYDNVSSSPFVKRMSRKNAIDISMTRFSRTKTYPRGKKNMWKSTGVSRRETFSNFWEGGEKYSKEKIKQEKHKKLIRQTVRWHNKSRTYHNSPPLVWSNECYEHALMWAKYLAENNDFFYSKDRMNMGENLAMFSDYKVCTPRRVLKRWYSEIRDYNFKFHTSRNSNRGVNHFTQLVWKETKEVGMAIVKSEKEGNYIVVANYHPSGNWLSHYHENVLPKQLSRRLKKNQIEEEEEEEVEEEVVVVEEEMDHNNIIRRRRKRRNQNIRKKKNIKTSQNYYFFEKHRYEPKKKKKKKKVFTPRTIELDEDGVEITEQKKKSLRFFSKFGVRTKRMDQNSLDLFIYLNNKRQSMELSRIPFSPQLTLVSQVHCQDLWKYRPHDEGQGNMHSWSKEGDGFFKHVEYTPDHRHYQKMLDKPKEICGYEDSGFECVVKIWDGNPRKIVKMLQRSAQWEIFSNTGIWTRYRWVAMGCAFNNSFACIWLGCTSDSSKSIIFNNHSCFV